MGTVAGYTAAGAPILTVHSDAVIVAAYSASTMGFAGIGAARAATVDGVADVGVSAVEGVSQGPVTGVSVEIVGTVTGGPEIPSHKAFSQ